MTNIYDLTNLIREERAKFQARMIDTEETKKRELESLKSDYIPGSKTYRAKEVEIEQTYTRSIVNARAKLAEAITEEIESLREFELAKVGRIDADNMAKVNALRGIPMTAMELQAVLDKHGASNYWVQRAVASMAEENGVSVSELKLPASIDTKLSVLSQIEEQLDKMMNDFDMKAKTPEAMNARFLYLNNDVLSNAEEMYNNHLYDISEADAATRAYFRVKATTGQMGKAVGISNALRNLRSKDAKNLFLYQLSCDSDISDEAFAVAGISDVMDEWRVGKKNERFAEARKLAEEVRTMKDVGKVAEHLQKYADKVSLGEVREDEFLPHELKKVNKKNSSVMQAIQEMRPSDRSLFAWESQQPTPHPGTPEAVTE